MSDNQKELATLVGDTLCWMKKQLQEGMPFSDPKPLSPIKEKKEDTQAITPLPKLPKNDHSKHKHSPSTSDSRWVLSPMPFPDYTDVLYDRFAPSLPDLAKIKPVVPIVLILPTDQPSYRFFFERMARAITNALAPARVILAENVHLKHLLSDQEIKLLIAERFFLQKIPDELQSHHFYPTKGPTLFPLEKIDCYLTDLDLKRTLWNGLKSWHSPNMPLSSST